MPTERASEPAPRSKWNYHPELPLADKSIFGWPSDIGFLARWFRRNWLSLSERMLLLLVAVAAWYFLYPDLDEARTFAVGWIAQTWIVNMALMLAVAASHPVHVIYNLHYQALGAPMTHTGYENLLIRDKRRLALGTFYHQLHHRFFECNYGNQEMPWDRWFGTFHDGSDEATRTIRERKQRMHAGVS